MTKELFRIALFACAAVMCSTVVVEATTGTRLAAAETAAVVA